MSEKHSNHDSIQRGRLAASHSSHRTRTEGHPRLSRAPGSVEEVYRTAVGINDALCAVFDRFQPRTAAQGKERFHRCAALPYFAPFTYPSNHPPGCEHAESGNPDRLT